MRNLSSALFLGATICLILLGGSRAAPAAQLWVSCKPVEAAAFPERIHVKCETPIDDRFWYFAASTKDPRVAARALSVIEAAQVGEKLVHILFDPTDQSGTTFGCLAADCRQLLAVVMAETPLEPPSRCTFDNDRRGCPGYCSRHDDQSCPGYCARHPDDRGCPDYCARNAEDRTCPDFCRRHPRDPDCPREDPCDRNPHLPQCRR